MKACIIEFGVKPGMDDERKRLLAELFVELGTFDGFLGKETYDDCDKPGRRITISWWTDAESIDRWMKNRAHLRSIGLGKREVFSYYQIRIASIDRETSWSAAAAEPASSPAI